MKLLLPALLMINLSFGLPIGATEESSVSEEVQVEVRFKENLYPEWAQVFRQEQIVYQGTTPMQKVEIFDHALFGRVLALDEVVQLTEADEFIYHEMIVHVPLLAHGRAKKVLVIGGGDGGAIREVLRHQTVERVVLVEIDEEVISLSRKHLPHVAQGAFEDPRVEVVIGDGFGYVEKSQEHFDVIICDSTDPMGPGKTLFTPEFYAACRRVVGPKGILVVQNGVPFLQKGELIETLASRKQSFTHSEMYTVAVPTYVGGLMALGFATDHAPYLHTREALLKKRLPQVKGEMRYYTPEVHKASFALPKFLAHP